MCYTHNMKAAHINTFTVKFLTNDEPETVAYAAELIEIELKSIEFLSSGGNHIDFDDDQF